MFSHHLVVLCVPPVDQLLLRRAELFIGSIEFVRCICRLLLGVQAERKQNQESLYQPHSADLDKLPDRKRGPVQRLWAARKSRGCLFIQLSLMLDRQLLRSRRAPDTRDVSHDCSFLESDCPIGPPKKRTKADCGSAHWHE